MNIIYSKLLLLLFNNAKLNSSISERWIWKVLIFFKEKIFNLTTFIISLLLLLYKICYKVFLYIFFYWQNISFIFFFFFLFFIFIFRSNYITILFFVRFFRRFISYFKNYYFFNLWMKKKRAIFMLFSLFFEILYWLTVISILLLTQQVIYIFT